jgi:uncharacterized protein
MKELNHLWLDNYRISLSTNGLLYNDERVQRFIADNTEHISFGISIDGTKEKHDLQRVFPDGSGSYDAVVKNVKHYLEQFHGGHTKATIAHDDVHLVKDSILHLWELGFHSVAMNCISEDVWKDGDDEIFESQLVQLADIIIEKRLYNEYQCSLFDRGIGFYLNPAINNDNWCGAGKMLAIDTEGNFHPCNRFIGFSLEHQPAFIIGNTTDGIDDNKLRPFLALNRTSQSSQECIDCDVASGCAWCQGYNYDTSGTIYHRATNICKMHKARVRANNYLWNKLDKIVPPNEDDNRMLRLHAKRKGLQTLFVITDSEADSFCYYETKHLAKETMTVETLRNVVYYALTNNLTLNLLVGRQPLKAEFKTVLKDVDYILLRSFNTLEKNENAVDIFDYENDTFSDAYTGSHLIIRITRQHLPVLPDWLVKYSLQYDRISLVIKDLTQATESDYTDFKGVLKQIADWLPEREEQKPLELSFLTDRLILTGPNHWGAFSD